MNVYVTSYLDTAGKEHQDLNMTIEWSFDRKRTSIHRIDVSPGIS